MDLAKKVRNIALGLGLAASVVGCAALGGEYSEKQRYKMAVRPYSYMEEDRVKNVEEGHVGKIISRCNEGDVTYFKTKKPLIPLAFISTDTGRIYFNTTSVSSYAIKLAFESIRHKKLFYDVPEDDPRHRLYVKVFDKYTEGSLLDPKLIEKDLHKSFLVHEMAHRENLNNRIRSEEIAMLAEVKYNPLLGLLREFFLLATQEDNLYNRAGTNTIEHLEFASGISRNEFPDNLEKISQAADTVLRITYGIPELKPLPNCSYAMN